MRNFGLMVVRGLVGFAVLGASLALAEVVAVDAAPPEVRIVGQRFDRGPDRLNLGWYMASGDFNADGYSDIATSGRTHEPFPSVLLFFGGPGRPSAWDLESRPADVTLRQPPFRVNTACLGTPMLRDSEIFLPLAAGDLTGDGIDDLAISGSCWDRGGQFAGQVFVVPGRGAWPAELVVDPEIWSPALLGEDIEGRFGEYIAISDVDGDTQVDLVVSAVDAPGAQSSRPVLAGRAYVFLGPMRVDARMDASGAAAIISGSHDFARIGETLGAADIDGDGRAEILLGMDHDNDARLVMIDGSVSGSVVAQGEVVIRDLVGERFGDHFAETIAAGQWDCGGDRELLINSNRHRGPLGDRNVAGMLQIFEDVVQEPSVALTVFGRALRPLSIGDTRYQIGDVALRDLNGDTFDDIILATPGRQGPDNLDFHRGGVTVIWNRPDIGSVLDLDTDSPHVLTLDGPLGGFDHGAGLHVADFDGSGTPDLIVGSVWTPRSPDTLRDGALDIFTRDLQPTPVTARAGADQVVEVDPLGATCEGALVLDAGGSTDAAGDPLVHRWFTSGSLLAEGERPAVRLPLGDHCIRLLSESIGGWDQDRLDVLVEDRSAPVITSVSASPASLWPPNHRMVDVTVQVDARDPCTEPEDLQVRLVSVTSSESDDGRGDGRTAPDFEGFEIGTADLSGRLRAERSGSGAGRVYTLTYDVADLGGNTARVAATVTVGHDRRAPRVPLDRSGAVRR